MKKTAVATVDLSDPAKPKFILQHRSLFNQDLAAFGDGVKLKITLENYYRQRTQKQSAVFHWYCSELAEECGMMPEDFKMMMKMKFITKAAVDKDGEPLVDKSTGEVFTYIPSTKDLTTVEMVDLCENVRMFGLEFLNYSLPLPDANYTIHFLEEVKKQKSNNKS